MRLAFAAIVVVALAPLIVLAIGSAESARRERLLDTQMQALNLARLGAAAPTELIAEMRGIMAAWDVASRGPLAEPSDCGALVRTLVTNAPWLLAVGEIDRAGRVVCHVDDKNEPPHSIDARAWTRPVPHVDLICDDPKGRALLRVVTQHGDDRLQVAWIDLGAVDWPAVMRGHAGDDVRILLTDGRRGFIAGNEGWQLLATDDPLARAVESRTDGVLDGDLVGRDGWLFGFTTLGLADEPRLVIGLPKAQADGAAAAVLAQHLSVFAVILVIALAVTWFGSDLLVVRWVRALQGSMSQIGDGRFDVTTAVPSAAGELADLGRDVSTMAAHLKARTEALDEAKRAAEAASQARAEFMATIGHELRAPLNGILGFTDLALERGLDRETRRLIERVRDAATGLKTLVCDLLDTGKIDVGRLTLAAAPFDLPETLESGCALLQGEAQSKGLDLRVVLDPDLPRLVLGDQTRFRQILLNFVGNAVKYTDTGYVIVTATRAPEDPAMVTVSVSDTGIGIDEHERSRLFERFAQLPQGQSRPGGSGLGLAIAKHLVELMGGEVGLDSVPGVGSNFWFRVMLPPVVGTVATAHEDHTPMLRAARILVVDDQSINREFADALLRRLGHEPLCLGSGAEAVEALARDSYDLVLLDIEMPGMDGYRTAAALRELGGPASAVPIIAMTGYDRDTVAERCLAVGMTEVLGKPVERAVLERTISRVLGSSWEDTSVIPTKPASGKRQKTTSRPSDEVDLVDDRILEGLSEKLGADGTDRLLDLVRDDLEARRVAAPPDFADRETLRQLAHDLTGVAGNFGLAALAHHAQALSRACASGGDVAEPYRAILDALPRTISALEARRPRASISIEEAAGGRPA